MATSGTITLVGTKKVDNPDGGYKRQTEGSGQRNYLQTGTGGDSPGAVDVGTVESVVDFGDLDSPGICRMENLSSEYDVIYGHGSAAGFVLRKRIVDANGVEQFQGGIFLGELDNVNDLRVKVDPASGSGSGTPSARIQVSAEEF